MSASSSSASSLGNAPGLVDASTLPLFEISTNKANAQTALNLSIPFSSEDQRFFFSRTGSDGIGIYEAQTVRMSNLPAGLTIDSIDFLLYPGNDIQFSSTAVGRLDKDFDANGTVIPAGTTVITGSYYGHPALHTIRVYGRYPETSAMDENTSLVERPMDGEIYLFAEQPADDAMEGGVWLFVPEVQQEANPTNPDDVYHCYTSVLPCEIQAVLYRTDDRNSADHTRKVSDTLWIFSPSYDSMPNLVLGGENP